MNWNNVKNLLCVRLDNMGDVLMSTPALSALKKALGCRITLLTSTMGAPICEFIPLIDDVMIFDAPWVKSDAEPSRVLDCVEQLKARNFDAAMIFTVFSQNPLPTAMLLYLAGIPRRLAFSRENPYALLTDWIPDDEPYTTIRHQVERDLFLANHISRQNESSTNARLHSPLQLRVDESLAGHVFTTLRTAGVDTEKPWLILHPVVSERKREYPVDNWIQIGKQLNAFGFQLVITGPDGKHPVGTKIHQGIGTGSFLLSGKFSIGELVLLIHHAPLVITVNTAVVHIAAATQTEVIVLYAETNPQHTPWMVNSRVFTFPVEDALQSRNEVLRFVRKVFSIPGALPANPNDVAKAAIGMLQ